MTEAGSSRRASTASALSISSSSSRDCQRARQTRRQSRSYRIKDDHGTTYSAWPRATSTAKDGDTQGPRFYDEVGKIATQSLQKRKSDAQMSKSSSADKTTETSRRRRLDSAEHEGRESSESDASQTPPGTGLYEAHEGVIKQPDEAADVLPASLQRLLALGVAERLEALLAVLADQRGGGSSHGGVHQSQIGSQDVLTAIQAIHGGSDDACVLIERVRQAVQRGKHDNDRAARYQQHDAEPHRNPSTGVQDPSESNSSSNGNDDPVAQSNDSRTTSMHLDRNREKAVHRDITAAAARKKRQRDLDAMLLLS